MKKQYEIRIRAAKNRHINMCPDDMLKGLDLPKSASIVVYSYILSIIITEKYGDFLECKNSLDEALINYTTNF